MTVVIVILSVSVRVFLIFWGAPGCQRIIAGFNSLAIHAGHRLRVELPSGSLRLCQQFSFRPFDRYALHLETSSPDCICLSIK